MGGTCQNKLTNIERWPRWRGPASSTRSEARSYTSEATTDLWNLQDPALGTDLPCHRVIPG